MYQDYKLMGSDKIYTRMAVTSASISFHLSYVISFYVSQLLSWSTYVCLVRSKRREALHEFVVSPPYSGSF
jgi:hypothetical protein